MPQASEEMRSEWGGLQGVGEDKAEAHLAARGFKLTRQWEWVKPSPDYVLDADDCGAISFLICEWDYGGLASVDTLPKGQDAQRGLAGTEGGAVGEAETPNT